MPGRTLVAGGREYLYFSGTSYLGISRNEEFQAHLQVGIKRYGVNYSSSRISNVQLSVFEETENYLAAYTGAEAALTVSSGFLAGQLVIRSLIGNEVYIYGPRTHPALWRRNQDFNNLNFKDWTNQLPARIATANQQDIFILFNSLDPLLAQKYELAWLRGLKTAGNITVIIDDSHGLGITGRNGAGIWGELLVPANCRTVVVSSLGKAMGIPGGVIISDTATIQTLRKSPFFGGSSPVIPAYLYAFLQSANIYQEAREKLFRNINYFKSLLKASNLFQTFPDYPVFYTAQQDLYPYLLAHDILISSFAYPTPADEPVTRIIISSLHNFADLERLATLVNKYAAEHIPL